MKNPRIKYYRFIQFIILIAFVLVSLNAQGHRVKKAIGNWRLKKKDGPKPKPKPISININHQIVNQNEQAQLELTSENDDEAINPQDDYFLSDLNDVPVREDELEFFSDAHVCGSKSPPEKTLKFIDDLYQKNKHTVKVTSNEIDVFWHLFFEKIDEKIPDYLIYNQMQILNDAYSGLTYISALNPFDCEGNRIPRGINTGVHFNLKRIYHNYCPTGRKLTRDTDDERRMKEMSRKGNCRALNVYVADLDSYLGWSTFPWDCGADPQNDGVVLSRQVLPGGPTKHYSDGDILVHEVGHWLGLLHTFGDNTCSPGDYVEDTAPVNRATVGCPSRRDSCSTDEDQDPIHNYMDYTYNCCMYEFTNGQAKRMSYILGKYRLSSTYISDDDYHFDDYYIDDDRSSADYARIVENVNYDDFYYFDDYWVFDDFFRNYTQICFCLEFLNTCYGCGRCYI